MFFLIPKNVFFDPSPLFRKLLRKLFLSCCVSHCFGDVQIVSNCGIPEALLGATSHAPVRDVVWSPDGELLLAASVSGSRVWRWDSQKGWWNVFDF